jgi:hypothetical protein
MLALAVFFGLFFLTALIWFVSPKLSPIPYYPTSEKDMERIKKALDLKKKCVLYDLGAGDGKIIFRFASASVKTVAVESNPYLVLVMHLKRLFHPHKTQIRIICQDLFKTDLKQATHIYLFVGPYLVDRISQYLLKKHSQSLRKVIFYRYFPKLPLGSPVRLWRSDTGFCDKQKPPIFFWQFRKGP